MQNLQITINVDPAGKVSVNGFPTNFGLTTQVMDAARNAVTLFFIQAARDGKLGENGVVNDSIVTEVQRPELILPH